jgi:hypothetical protein
MTAVTDYEQLARVSRRALHMYDLTERERRVSEVIIEWSFGRGRESAVIPELQAFVDLTGLDRADVSRALKLLITRRIVQRRGPRDALAYEFLPAASYWKETKPLFDPLLACDRAAELDRINGQMKLAIEEPDLDDAMASVSRETALAEEDRTDKVAAELTAVEPGSPGKETIGESPTTGGVGKTPMTGSVGESPIASRHARTRARDVMQNVSTKRFETLCTERTQVRSRNDGETSQNGADGCRSRTFRDPEKNYVFEALEEIAAGPDFDRYRPAWINRVRNFPGIVREAVGEVKMFRNNPRNKLNSAGAMIFRRCQQIAREHGKTFHLW